MLFLASNYGAIYVVRETENFIFLICISSRVRDFSNIRSHKLVATGRWAFHFAVFVYFPELLLLDLIAWHTCSAAHIIIKRLAIAINGQRCMHANTLRNVMYRRCGASMKAPVLSLYALRVGFIVFDLNTIGIKTKTWDRSCWTCICIVYTSADFDKIEIH